MARTRKREHDDRLDEIVHGRAPVQVNQHADKFEDRRTRRIRDRSGRERNAIEDQDD